MLSTPNPEGTARIVPCPQALIDGYKPRSSAWTIMLKGIDRTSGTGQINENISNLTVGVNTGTTLTFNITAPHAGEYDLSFSVQTGIETNISATVNGQPAGSTGNFNPNNWNSYTLVPHGSKVNLTQGANTITLSFVSNSVNFDYFVLVGEEQHGQTSVKPNAARANKANSSVVLRPANRGFTAVLPNNHTFESYSLVDIRGREIRKGKIHSGAAELSIGNIRQGVTFLRLSGKSGTTVLRATTF